MFFFHGKSIYKLDDLKVPPFQETSRCVSIIVRYCTSRNEQIPDPHRKEHLDRSDVRHGMARWDLLMGRKPPRKSIQSEGQVCIQKLGAPQMWPFCWDLVNLKLMMLMFSPLEDFNFSMSICTDCVLPPNFTRHVLWPPSGSPCSAIFSPFALSFGCESIAWWAGEWAKLVGTIHFYILHFYILQR